MDLVAAAADERRLELVVDIAEIGPARLMGDVTRLRQVLVNLLSNAVKFTPAGEIVVRVRTANAPDGHQELHLSVTDSGIGITPEGQQRLFRSFSRRPFDGVEFDRMLVIAEQVVGHGA